MVVSLSFPQKNIYASYLGESLSGENENLTEDEISRIKEKILVTGKIFNIKAMKIIKTERRSKPYLLL